MGQFCSAFKTLRDMVDGNPITTLICFLEEDDPHEKGHYDFFDGLYWRPDTDGNPGNGGRDDSGGKDPDPSLPPESRLCGEAAPEPS